MITDEYINKLFDGVTFGAIIDNSVTEKRKLIAKTLRNQIEGYWSGHTVYNIVVQGGFLHDAKPGETKKLTALGLDYIGTYEQ